MSFFSIVIPTYNSKKYVEITLQSILDNEFDDFVIEIFDDGSTDGTPDLISETFKNDNRVKVHRMDHCGPANIKNSAIQEVDGDYILFVDSDDLLNNMALSKLHAKIVNSGYPELVIFNLDYFTDFIDPNASYERPISVETMENGAPTKVFRKDLLKKIEFPKNTLFEDVAFCINAVLMSKHTIMMPDILYYYRQHRESLTKQKQNALRRLDILTAYKGMFDIDSSSNIDSTIKKKLYTNIAKTVFGHIKKSIVLNEEDSSKLFDKLYDYMERNEIVQKSDASLKWKFKYWVVRQLVRLKMNRLVGLIAARKMY